MSLSVSSISGIVPGSGLQSIGTAASSPHSGNSFASALEGAIQSVEQPGQQAGSAIQNFLNGDGEELHNVALAVQKANLAFDLGLQVRNKIVSAYQEVMKMQI
jgi:flagellar hook-basal body complex protein FliE